MEKTKLKPKCPHCNDTQLITVNDVSVPCICVVPRDTTKIFQEKDIDLTDYNKNEMHQLWK